jgi:hypothetical protein
VGRQVPLALARCGSLLSIADCKGGRRALRINFIKPIAPRRIARLPICTASRTAGYSLPARSPRLSSAGHLCSEEGVGEMYRGWGRDMGVMAEPGRLSSSHQSSGIRHLPATSWICVKCVLEEVRIRYRCLGEAGSSERGR